MEMQSEMTPPHQHQELRLQQIREGIHHLKELIADHSVDEELEDTILLDTMGQVLESLERTFIHHFEATSGHTVSPKSDEPWD